MTTLLRHREKVLAHAEQQLASQGKTSDSELLTLYKKFLKIENHRLRLKHYAGGGGLDGRGQGDALLLRPVLAAEESHLPTVCRI